MDRPSTQRRQGERRRLFDRRAPNGRRHSDERRRNGAQQVPSDRRVRTERRGADRRSQASRRRGRRRRETPTPYTTEQMTALRKRFAEPGVVTCPACEGRFALGPSRRRGAELARRVMCLGCSRAAVVPNSRAARILLVDHHTAVRDVLHGMLASAGHEVIEADDAAVALVAYQMVPADVVILDILSPGRMPAPDFLRQLRRNFPDARVVALAGRPSFTGVDPLAVAAGLGAVRTIRMPVAREDLLRIVEEARP